MSVVNQSAAMLETNCGLSWVLDISATSTRANLVSLIIFNIVSLCSTIFLNASAIIVLWRLDHIPGSAKIILLNLSLTDLLTGLLSQPLFISFMALQLDGSNVCAVAKATTFCGFLLWVVSFSTLVLACAERYVCLLHPFTHQRVSSSRIFALLIASFWFSGLLFSILYQISGLEHSLGIAAAILNGFGCMLMAFVYIRVYYLASKIRKEIRDQAQAVNPNAEDSKNRRAAANMIALIVALSLLCYTPYSVALYMDILARDRVSPLLFNWFWTLVMVNSPVNPVCYVLLNKVLHKKMFALWKGIFKS